LKTDGSLEGNDVERHEIDPSNDTRATDPLLIDGRPRLLLLGNEAIVRGALEAGVAFASGYPGTPSSEVTDSFARVAPARDIAFEYSVNEKVALEMAFAASLAGARSICAMKHLGLMVAGDPLSTIPYVGVVGGMVIVSAGDPSLHTSPNEQDQRHLGPMLHLPILDPSTPLEAHVMTRAAFELSERSQLPVLLRITTRVAHTRAVVPCGPLKTPAVAGFVRDPQRFVPIPPNARRLRLEIDGRLEQARVTSETLFRREGRGRRAILASGAPAATCADILRESGSADEVILATLGAVHPLPEAGLLELFREVDQVLVVEELSPFLEDAVGALCARHDLRPQILGKRTGHLPEAFEYEPAVIRRGLHLALGLGTLAPEAAPAEAVAPRPPTLCSGCPHRSTYFAARSAFGEDQLYFNDIGCYTLGFGAPLDTVDALLCMGAGFTLAAGVSRVTKQRTVGFLGDSTFFHSGMPALLNAIKEDVDMVAVILDNQVTAMTGFQESPTVTVEDHQPGRQVSIEGVVRALGARHVETVDPADVKASIAAFERARDATGLSVIIAEHPCPVHMLRLGEPADDADVFTIDHAACQQCGRDAAGLRCTQCVTVGLERHMARSRALEIVTDAGSEPQQVAPCATRCPLGLCVQGYAGHIAGGQYREALELIMSRCPLPDSICRVCHRPCETVCVRSGLDEAVAINDLKRFVMDWAAGQDQQPYRPERDPSNGKRVAVVGAGPAGLAAAHDLCLRGYHVTLYDAGATPGGLLASGIPEFRLPSAALERDVERILGLGVDFRGETVLGRDIRLGQLLDGQHDAVFLAVGAHRPRQLSLDTEGDGGGPLQQLEALGYLAAIRSGHDVAVGPRVVVVGGGNAAIDAARTARRAGARVTIIYRRRREEMPALVDEIAAAEDEGIELHLQCQPVRVVHGVRSGLACVTTEPGDPDASGRRRPVDVEGSERLIEADTLIVAAGQSPQSGFLTASDPTIERDGEGCLIVDPETLVTSHPQVFAGGDVVAAERTVTGAVALGQRAAWGIDRALRGPEQADLRPPPPRPEAWPQPRPLQRLPMVGRQWNGRQHPDELDAASRIDLFDEVTGALTEEQARAEASRCAVCGQCGNCRACLDLFGCPAFYVENGLIEIDPSLCNGCGVCARFCPTGAIQPVERGLN